MIFMIVALVLAVLAPMAAYMVQFAISRRREYLADATAVQLTRNPLGLARALNEIASDPQPLRSANRATAHLFIANPLKGKKLKESAGLFDTHPPIQKRIAILLEMAHAAPDSLTRSRQGMAADAAATGTAAAQPSPPLPQALAGVPPAGGGGRKEPPPPIVPH
jgi:hypothetical protein